jgi:hypothetical protein
MATQESSTPNPRSGINQDTSPVTPEPTAGLFGSKISPLSGNILDVDISQIKSSGQLWISRSPEVPYLVIDWDHQKLFTAQKPPSECSQHPLNTRTYHVLCQTPDGLYLYDLLSGEVTQPNIGKYDYLYSQDNYIYSVYKNSLGMDYVEILDLVTFITIKLPLPNNLGWDTPPILSNDGIYAIGVIHETLVDIDLQDHSIDPIMINGLRVTSNLAWSPKSSLLAFGATDEEFEIGIMANQILLYNGENHEVRQITKRIKPYNEIDWPIWSHNGKMIIGVSGNEVCVNNIETETENCISTQTQANQDDYRIINPQWSADNQFIAFLEQPNGNFEPGNLVLYSLENGNVIILMKDTIIGAIFWH